MNLHVSRLKAYWQRIHRYKFQPGFFSASRSNWIIVGILFLFSLLGFRAIAIHIFPAQSQSLEKMASQQYQKMIKLSRYRGVIYDRRGDPLAISIRVPSLFVNPRVFDPNPTEIKQLANILDMSSQDIKKIATKPLYFAWLKRKTSKIAAQKVALMNLKGLEQVMEPSRFYPAGQAAANLLGYVGIDDKGLGGIERQYDHVLGGQAVQMALAKDAKGRPIVSTLENAAPEEAGSSIKLTLDRAIQEIAERALDEGVERAKAKGGMAIVADPHTGKILALANAPSFDPNNQRQIDINAAKNQALMNVFEPGSVVKPLVVAIALGKQTVHAEQEFDCEGGKLKIGNRTINDSHPPKKQYLNVEEIVMHSSNVCTYKIAKTLGPESLYNGLRQMGIGERVQRLGFPGEGLGGMVRWDRWIPVQFANIAFGQGITTSALELVQAYGAIANGGRLMKPALMESIEGQDEALFQPQSIRQAMSPKVARKVRRILQRTIDEAVVNAKLEGYSAGGKTGTSQKVEPGTRAYSKTKHLSSFIGLAPIEDPHLVVYVQVDEPNQATSYGSLWAAPIFKQIAEQTLRYLNVAEDRTIAANEIPVKSL